MTNIPAEGEPVTYDTHLRPLFRPQDRESMRSHFDLWSYNVVRAHSSAILTWLRAGTMPCDGAWPAQQVDLIQRWIDTGTPR